MAGRKSKKRFKRIMLLNATLIAVILLIMAGRYTAIGRDLWSVVQRGPSYIAANFILRESEAQTALSEEEKSIEEDQNETEQNETEQNETEQDKADAQINVLLVHADSLAEGYYYEDAIHLIKSYQTYSDEPALVQALQRYETAKDSLVLYEGPISHIFFHSLIADTKKAFDGDSMENGYNYWMTTVSEFNKMLEQMYERGYVLIDIHDIAGPVEENGKTRMKKKDIYLPEGKKPLILSQDDVNYYNYMKEDGFAARIVIDDYGNSACEIEIDGKMVTARDYDVIPLLDVFVEQHPDFSYQGAKGIIALTGYEGALGYRTNQPNSPTYEEDREAVKKIAEQLKSKGWEFASHSYGHRHMKEISYEKFVSDGNRWHEEVADLVGETDIYIYPYGEEVEYTGNKIKYLKEKGFNYFCGVYAKPWLEITDPFIRMTRRNLDGFTMHFYPDRIKDLFDLEYVYDKERPAFR